MKILNAILPEHSAKLHATLEDDGLRIDHDDGFHIFITAFLSGEDRPRDKYKCTLVRCVYFGESQVVEVQANKSGNTIGYIFPIASLSATSSLDSQGAWKKNYARIASLSILIDGIANDFCNYIDLTSYEVTKDISDIVDLNMGVLVTGAENLIKNDMSHDETVLMVQELGIVPYLAKQKTSTVGVLAFQERVGLDKVSKDILPEIHNVQQILSATWENTSPISRFLSLYQIIELIIQKVFECCISNIVVDVAASCDSWIIKENLQDITNEKWRINQVRAKYLVGSHTHDVFQRFVSVAKELLTEIKNEVNYKEDELDWAYHLYLIRNIVVHRQHLVVTQEIEKLQAVTASLVQVCFSIIKDFSITTGTTAGSRET